MADANGSILEPLEHRFGERLADPGIPIPAAHTVMAARGSCRAFRADTVSPELVRYLCALALTAPTKSDLQQRDIVVVRDPAKHTAIATLIPGQPWIADAPVLLVFCGNNRRQRQIHGWHGVPFVNDHLDVFFNATVDAAIALAAFVNAAEAAGLGCCPISEIRNHAAAVSALLELPDHVFPVAGLGLGYPDGPPMVSPRLPLSATVHEDRFREQDLQAAISSYDVRRSAVQPYRRQRHVELFGTAEAYGWSVDKARQYAKPDRADFGAFVRSKGFNLD